MVRSGASPAVLLLFLFCMVSLVANAQVLQQQLRQVSRNLTTHEHFNASRLNYLWAGN